jgi:hypothetical protein
MARLPPKSRHDCPGEAPAQAAFLEKALQNRVFHVLAGVSRQAARAGGGKETGDNRRARPCQPGAASL